MIVYRELSSLARDLGVNARLLYAVSNSLDRHYRQCLLPHRRNSYDYVIGKYPEIMELARRPKNTP